MRSSAVAKGIRCHNATLGHGEAAQYFPDHESVLPPLGYCLVDGETAPALGPNFGWPMFG